MINYTLAVCLVAVMVEQSSGFWDEATTTLRMERDKDEGRTSFFRWQWTYLPTFRSFFHWWDFNEIDRRMRTGVVAGLSIDWQCITTGALLNRRIVLTSMNAIFPHMPRQHYVRIWAAGREGSYNTPYRYRVHRIHGITPRSGNTEHCHGLYCVHQPRHDIAIIASKDQIYLYSAYRYLPYTVPHRYFFAFRTQLAEPSWTMSGEVWYAGSGYEYMEHIHENYKIFYGVVKLEKGLRDCSKFLPKWWGKFICFQNWQHFPGIQNGGPLLYQPGNLGNPSLLIGVGCFEIRYNDQQVFVFTDLRFYYYRIRYIADIGIRSYYEFAYPQWMVQLSWISPMFDSSQDDPQIPYHYWLYRTDDTAYLG